MALGTVPSAPELSDTLEKIAALQADPQPDPYALYNLIEAVVGESPTRKKGTLRSIAEKGKLDDFEELVDRLNNIDSDDVKDDIDLEHFSHIVSEAKDAIPVIRSVLQMPRKPRNAVEVGAFHNQLTAEGGYYTSDFRGRFDDVLPNGTLEK